MFHNRGEIPLVGQTEDWRLKTISHSTSPTVATQP